MRVDAFHHLSRPLVDDLRAALRGRSVLSVDAAIAYVQTGGTLWLHDELKRLKGLRRPVRLVAGVDMGITSAEALRHLIDVGVEAYVYRANGHAFHGKTVVMSDGRGPVEAFIGSGNWTYGGLVINSELTSHLVAETTADRRLLQSLADEIATLRANARRLRSPADLTRAVTDFSLPSELTARRRATDSGPRSASGHGRSVTSSLRPNRRSTLSASATAYQSSVFSRSRSAGIPRARTPRRGSAIPLPASVAPGAQLSTIYCMLNDVQVATTPGEVRLPMAALTIAPIFWGYPRQFTEMSRSSGTFHERFVRARFTSSNRVPAIVNRVRIYRYVERSEFRITSHEFRLRGREDDIVAITFSRGVMHCDVIRQGDPGYAAARASCTIVMPSGGRATPRYWGII